MDSFLVQNLGELIIRPYKKLKKKQKTNTIFQSKPFHFYQLMAVQIPAFQEKVVMHR